MATGWKTSMCTLLWKKPSVCWKSNFPWMAMAYEQKTQRATTDRRDLHGRQQEAATPVHGVPRGTRCGLPHMGQTYRNSGTASCSRHVATFASHPEIRLELATKNHGTFVSDLGSDCRAGPGRGVGSDYEELQMVVRHGFVGVTGHALFARHKREQPSLEANTGGNLSRS